MGKGPQKVSRPWVSYHGSSQLLSIVYTHFFGEKETDMLLVCQLVQIVLRNSPNNKSPFFAHCHQSKSKSKLSYFSTKSATHRTAKILQRNIFKKSMTNKIPRSRL